jgi:hypothetical protein
MFGATRRQGRRYHRQTQAKRSSAPDQLAAAQAAAQRFRDQVGQPLVRPIIGLVVIIHYLDHTTASAASP